MNLRRLALLLFATIAGAATAKAQLGVYGAVTVERASGIKCLATNGVCGSTDGTINPVGGFGGVYYDFKNYGRVRLGLDVRGGATTQSKSAVGYFTEPTRIYSALGGVRASFATRFDALRPYVQGSVGMARSNFQATSGYPVGVQYRGYAGADVRLLQNLDFRVVEFGIGAFQLGGSAYRTESISSGVVFHFSR